MIFDPIKFLKILEDLDPEAAECLTPLIHHMIFNGASPTEIKETLLEPINVPEYNPKMVKKLKRIAEGPRNEPMTGDELLKKFNIK